MARKVPARKALAKKVQARKVPAKKVPAKKTAVKKTAVKKTAVKKTAVNKVAAKKAPARKAAASSKRYVKLADPATSLHFGDWGIVRDVVEELPTDPNLRIEDWITAGALIETDKRGKPKKAASAK